MGWFSHCPVSRAATGSVNVTSATMIRNMSASSKCLVSRQQPKDGERRLAPKDVHRVLLTRRVRPAPGVQRSKSKKAIELIAANPPHRRYSAFGSATVGIVWV